MSKPNQLYAPYGCPLENLRKEKLKKTRKGKDKCISQTDLGEILSHEHILSDVEKSELEEKGISTGIWKGTIGTWERGEVYPDIQNLIKLADYYGVSTDYILGRIQSRNVGNKEISLATGLSEESIEVLRALNSQCADSDDFVEHRKSIDLINMALEDVWLQMNSYYKVAPEDHSPVTTVFHTMMQYILSDNSELRYIDGEEYKTIPSKMAIFDIDGDPTAYTVAELGREMIINRLKRWLEKKREEVKKNGINKAEDN